ncbi:MAG TPA: hypothetical protein VE621_11865 [Bryobacteraceae bacterium]|jgi:hypothetical protein|nr:hypothetical protein [Bryobacteraceae bacterium]
MNVRLLRRGFLLGAAPLLLEGADEEVFAGIPAVRFDLDGNNSIRVDLSDQGAEKYKCRVVMRKKRYYWANREDRELNRVDAGDFTYFLSPEGTGMIKIALKPGGTYDYMELLTTELKTVTYWGKRSR